MTIYGDDTIHEALEKVASVGVGTIAKLNRRRILAKASKRWTSGRAPGTLPVVSSPTAPRTERLVDLTKFRA